MANEQNRDQFDNEDKDTTGQAGQAQPTAEQDKSASSDLSGGTLGQGQSGGFGNQTSASPESGQQGQASTGQSGLGWEGETALDTRTESETGLGQSSEAGEQGSSFVGAQGDPSSDEYLRNNESQETAQKGNPDETDIEGSSNS